MRHITAPIGLFLLTLSSAWAQTATPGSPPATNPAEVGQTGGITDYWWIILLLIIAIAVILYFARRGSRT